jgi:putative flippase GtrA
MTIALARTVAHAPPGEILRFIAVGGGATLIYFLLATSFANLGYLLPTASAAAYLVSSAFSFIGHRAFTFASRGPLFGEIGRFVPLNLAGLAASLLAPIVMTNGMGLAPAYATLTSCVVVPSINYLAMRGLVFCRAQLRSGVA